MDPDVQALDDLRDCILAVDAQLAPLMTQRQGLVEQYEQHRAALYSRLGAGPVASPLPKRSGVGTRALLLWLGAALLGISALTFSAVAWSRLGDVGHAVLLLGATALSIALALAFRRRLPMTAEAFVGLTVVLALVDVYALRRAGLGAGLSPELGWAIGTAAVLGLSAALGRFTGRRTARFAVAALLPAPVVLLISPLNWPTWSMSIVFAVLAAAIVFGLGRWGAWFYREGRVVLGVQAVAAWGIAAVLALPEAFSADTVAGALGPTAAVAALALAPEIRLRLAPGRFAALLAFVVSVVPAAVALTLLAPVFGDDGAIAASVVLGAATVLVSGLLPLHRRHPALIAGIAFAAPGTLWAFITALPAVGGPLGWLASPWTGTVGLNAATVLEGPHTEVLFRGSWAAVVALIAVAVIGAVPALRRRFFGISCAAVAFAIALAPPTAGASVLIALAATATAFTVGLLVAAYVGRNRPAAAVAPLVGAAVALVPTVGWAAVSTGASVTTSALAVVAAVASALIARRSVVLPGCAALAAVFVAVFVGVAARAAGAGAPVVGFAVAIAAAATTLLGVLALGGLPRVGIALECAAAATALAGTYLALGSTPWLAGSLTVLAGASGLAALRPDRRTLYGLAAGVLALFAVWAWLSSAEVSVAEADTAPAAILLLAAGILRWRNAPGRSWLTLGSALVLAIGPTLGIGLINDDTARLVVAALLCLAAVLVGALLRLQAPLVLGALGLVVLGIDQWGGYLVALPRWITLGAVGVVLMWVGATIEHRRRDWRRASDAISRFG